MGAGVTCARCRRREREPGRTRCAECRAKDSAETLAYYYRVRRGVRGSWGGSRVPAVKISVEREGNMARLSCRCGARLAGTWSDDAVAEIIAGHRCASRGRVRGRTGAQMTLEGRS